MDIDDDFLLRLYNQELIALAAETETPKRLLKPDAAAKAVSPICGSEVFVELTLKGDKVADFGYEIEACALTKAVVAVMKRAILGKTRQDIARAGKELQAMLDGGPPPAGDWAGLKILAPVADYKARHNSILLPFEAAEKLLQKGDDVMADATWKDRQQALKDMRRALMRQLEHLTQTVAKNYDPATALLPDYLRVQEVFRMNAMAMRVVNDLLDDQPLKKVFAAASVKPRAEDLIPSPDARTDGRAGAFGDVLKALEIAERDFDLGYKELDRDQLAYWQEKHPIESDFLQTAYKENQRHFMKESLGEIRALIEGVRTLHDVSPAHKPPKHGNP